MPTSIFDRDASHAFTSSLRAMRNQPIPIGPRFTGHLCLVHHDTKDGRSERGSSVLRGAADVMISARKESCGLSDQVILSVSKIKDGQEPPAKKLRLAVIDLGPDPEEVGSRITSCRLVAANQALHGFDLVDALDSMELAILDAMENSFDAHFPPTADKLMSTSGVARSSFYEKVKNLALKGHLVRKTSGRSHTYYLPDWLDELDSADDAVAPESITQSKNDDPSTRCAEAETPPETDGNDSPRDPSAAGNTAESGDEERDESDAPQDSNPEGATAADDADAAGDES